MASGPITSWEIDRETVETVADLILGGSTITADGDCSHEIKRRLLLGRKAMTNLDSILKSRDITLPIKVRLVNACGSPRRHSRDPHRAVAQHHGGLHRGISAGVQDLPRTAFHDLRFGHGHVPLFRSFCGQLSVVRCVPIQYTTPARGAFMALSRVRRKIRQTVHENEARFGNIRRFIA